MTLFTWLFIIFLILYLYCGYPVLLALFSKVFGRKHRIDDAYRPSVTLIVSAYNEEKTIRQKIENCLELNYPNDKLNIIVVSDCSSDNTDHIVREYSEHSVTLLRQESRTGKTSGLNNAMSSVETDYVVFSDANAMYDPDALNNLARHFADPKVGYVVGHARYYDKLVSSAAQSENFYWNFEVLLKQWESDLSSVVGGDGAIYMIRSALYTPLEDTDINDFVNPLQIVAAGYRGIFDRNAFCSEEAADDFEKEYGRKVRIVNRSFNGLLRVKQLLNPLRYPIFSWMVISHKLLRWFSPFLLGAHFLASIALCSSQSGYSFGAITVFLYALLSVASVVGAILNNSGKRSYKIFFLPYYFILMNISCAYGILKRLAGEKIVTWSTVRSSELSHQTGALLSLLLSSGIFLISITTLIAPLLGIAKILSAIIVFLAMVLIYTYVGYPFLLYILRLFYRREHRMDETFRPSVTLLIAAYNEGAVLKEKLENSLQIDYPEHLFEIFVASDGSSDNTNEVVEQFGSKGVKLLALSPNRGKVTALNAAMKIIKSDIVVLSDANVMYQADAVKKMVRHFADPKIGAVSGKVVLRNDRLSYSEAENRYYSIEHFIQAAEGETGSMIGSDGAMYALRRELYTFPPQDTILDDFVISMSVVKQGYRLIHAKEARGFERNDQEMSGEFNRKVRIIAGGIQCLMRGDVLPPVWHLLTWSKLISHKVLRWVCGPVFMFLAIVSLYAFLIGAQLGVLAYFFAAGVWLVLLLEIISQVIPALKSIKLFTIIHYLMMMHLASIVGCWRGILGRQSVTWKRT